LTPYNVSYFNRKTWFNPYNVS